MAEVETSRDGGVLTITLNRPEVLNAFNGAMHCAIQDAFKEARDDEVRAVVVTGAGRGFCVGQDLTEFRESAGDIGERLRGTYHRTILALRGLGRYHLFHAAQADLLQRLGRRQEAAAAYGRALELATNPVERRFLERRLRELS